MKDELLGSINEATVFGNCKVLFTYIKQYDLTIMRVICILENCDTDVRLQHTVYMETPRDVSLFVS